jgi:hypothetical protein
MDSPSVQGFRLCEPPCECSRRLAHSTEQGTSFSGPRPASPINFFHTQRAKSLLQPTGRAAFLVGLVSSDRPAHRRSDACRIEATRNAPTRSSPRLARELGTGGGWRAAVVAPPRDILVF